MRNIFIICVIFVICTGVVSANESVVVDGKSHIEVPVEIITSKPVAPVDNKVFEKAVAPVVEEVGAEPVASVDNKIVEQVSTSVVGEVEADAIANTPIEKKIADQADIPVVKEVKVAPVGEKTGIIIAKKVEQKVPFWVRIRTKIEKITPKKKPSVTTAVGGVRGAKSEAGKELYWKGEEVVPKFVAAQELEKFNEALKKAEEGDIRTSRQLFENFMAEFPESELKSDALVALQEMDAVGDVSQ